VNPHGHKLGEKGAFRSNFLKSYFTGKIVETDLELIKDAFSAKDIEYNSKTFRKSNGSEYLRFTDLDWKIVNIDRDKTSIPNYNHLGGSFSPIYADTMCTIYAENGKSCSRIYKKRK